MSDADPQASSSTADILMQAELLASQMKELGSSQQAEDDPDPAPHETSLTYSESAADSAAVDQVMPSLLGVDLLSTDDRHASFATDRDDESQQSLKAILTQAEMLSTQMQSMTQTSESLLDMKANSTGLSAASNRETADEEKERDLDDLLYQAEKMAADMKQSLSTQASVNSRHSDTENPIKKENPPSVHISEENKELDAMLHKAEYLAAQMKAATSQSFRSSDISESLDNNHKKQDANHNGTLQHAEALAASLASESGSSRSDGRASNASGTTPTTKTETGNTTPQAGVHFGLDTPTLIRETDKILGRAEQQPTAQKMTEMNTPALIRKTDAILANSKIPATPAVTQPGDVPLETEPKTPPEAAAVDPNNQEEAAKRSLKESNELMERALSSLKEASAQCSASPEMQTPASVSVVPGSDEISSVGSGSVRSLHSLCAESPGLTHRKSSEIRGLPLTPPISEDEAVDAVVEATRQMAMALQQVSSNASKENQAPNYKNQKTREDEILEETRKMALTLQQISSPEKTSSRTREYPPLAPRPATMPTFDTSKRTNVPESPIKQADQSLSVNDDHVPLADYSSSGVSPASRGLDPCLEFEKQAKKADPSAHYVKVTNATVGDADYAPMVDYYTSTRRKKNRSGAFLTPRSNLTRKRVVSKKKQRNWIAVFLVIILAAACYWGVVLRTANTDKMTWVEVANFNRKAKDTSKEQKARSLIVEDTKNENSSRVDWNASDEGLYVNNNKKQNLSAEVEKQQKDRELRPESQLQTKPDSREESRVSRWPILRRLNRNLVRLLGSIAVLALVTLPLKLVLL